MMRPCRWDRIFLSLIAACGSAYLPGCGSEAPTPPVDSKQFEAARQDYQAVRRSEYRRDSLDPKAKAKPLPKADSK
jgi:hypothetical protein